MRPLILLLVTVCTAVAAHAQVAMRESADHARQATEAYKNRELSAFLHHSQQADALRPNHPRLLYNLASAYALNSRPDDAVATLGRVAAMGLDYPAAEDDDFAALRDTPAFRDLLRRFEANRAPVHRAEPALYLGQPGFIQEGITWDPVDRVFYATSIRQRRIVRVDRLGRVTEFVSNLPELWSALGARVDARRRQLWVATAALEQTAGIDPKDIGRSGLLVFDLRTGRLAGSYPLPEDGAKHTLGDLAVAPDGTVFTTDSQSPALYRLRRGGASLERIAPDAPLVSPQGIAIVPGGRLLVADYALGLLVVDPRTGAWRPVRTGPDVCLLGIDGIAVHGRDVFAIQNGTRPHRVLRIRLDTPAGTRVERVEVIEANTSWLEEPTLGEIVDGWFYFVANSQWNRFDEKGGLPPSSGLRGHAVLRTRL